MTSGRCRPGRRTRADGFPATDDMCARLSPIAYEHINFPGRYTFTAPRRAPACGPSTTLPHYNL
ncbi:hypothetical protein ABZ801_36135 [Actinomadura sp. NPDC047616]|uniref:hypothetical protein n=1 Tax=Actinomadura sp. NPDC047616 TaxID=3155914 RepID=UPI0033E9138B